MTSFYCILHKFYTLYNGVNAKNCTTAPDVSVVMWVEAASNAQADNCEMTVVVNLNNKL